MFLLLMRPKAKWESIFLWKQASNSGQRCTLRYRKYLTNVLRHLMNVWTNLINFWRHLSLIKGHEWVSEWGRVLLEIFKPTLPHHRQARPPWTRRCRRRWSGGSRSSQPSAPASCALCQLPPAKQISFKTSKNCHLQNRFPSKVFYLPYFDRAVVVQH